MKYLTFEMELHDPRPIQAGMKVHAAAMLAATTRRSTTPRTSELAYMMASTVSAHRSSSPRSSLLSVTQVTQHLGATRILPCALDPPDHRKRPMCRALSGSETFENGGTGSGVRREVHASIIPPIHLRRHQNSFAPCDACHRAARLICVNSKHTASAIAGSFQRERGAPCSRSSP
jgi:hypothetical protein